MKTYIKVLIGVVSLLVVFFVALNLYLTDERLQGIIVPKINEQIGREIQVERVGFTFFRTFPAFGLSIQKLSIPDTDVRVEQEEGRARIMQETGQRTLASLEEMLVSVNLWSLLSGNLSVNTLEVEQLFFNYIVYEDGTTNIDSLLEYNSNDSQPISEDESTEINLKSVRINQAFLGYIDQSTNSSYQLNGLDAFFTLKYGDVIESDVISSVQSLRVTLDGTQILDGIPLKLDQRSTLDLDNEMLTIENGTLNIRGLDLAMKGFISEWSQETILLDLSLDSSSDDLSSLLELMPDSMKEDLQGVETRGRVVVESTIKGRAGEGVIPDFNARISVDDGYLKYPGVESPIEEIRIRMEANNTLVTIDEFSAKADVNTVQLNGSINNPLEEFADFNLNADLNLDLATVKKFYPLEGYDLSGLFILKGNAVGEVAKSEEARFNADILLTDGYVKMIDLEEPIREMNVNLTATQDLVTIQSFAAKAAGNTLSLNGTVQHPLDETRSRFNMKGNLNLNLATIPSFYPIDTDTLDMRGQFVFDGTAVGRVAEAEKSTINGTLKLTNGYINYHELPHPLENIQIDSRIAGERFILTSSGLRTGGNQVTASGDVNKFMSDDPILNLLVKGNFVLDEVKDYVDLGTFIKTISGKAITDVRVTGGVQNPENLAFTGSVNVTDFFLDSDSLDMPIRDMNGELLFSNDDLNLRSLTFKMGESDFTLTGQLKNYMRLVEENPAQLAELDATFASNKLNVDEIYEWVPTPEDQKEPFLVELPKLKSTLQVDIKEMVFFGVSIKDIKGSVNGTDNMIGITNAAASFFGGNANGNMRWDVPQPDRTKLTFNGDLENMRIEELFKQMNPAGMASVQNYFSGGFSTNIEYITELDVFLDPITETTFTNGDFGMSSARMKNHPAQIKAAELLRNTQLADLSLDNLLSKVNIDDNVMTLTDLNITSQDIGVVLNGTQHLLTNVLDYRVSIVLPGNLANSLEPVLTKDGLEALKREDGKVMIPFRITGTTENPAAGLDTESIQAIITEYLRNRGNDAIRNRLRDLFN